jgi:hypothetical protein
MPGIHTDSRKTRHLRDVDQQLGRRQPQVERRDQALPARKQLRAGAVSFE